MRNSFEVVYDIGKLEAVQLDERTIELRDGKKLVYQICAPYMVDAGGVRSDKITLSMEQTKKKEIMVTVAVDQEWLLEEERTYPVILDPTIVTETTKAAIDSTFITSGQPAVNHSQRFELLIGRESSSYEYCRTLMKIDLPALNPGDMVVSAQANLIMYNTDFYAAEMPDMQVNAHLLTGSWNYSTVTWNTRPRYNSEQKLYPRYTITYRNNKGLEDYWTYSTFSAGTAGTAYLNDYTGNLVFVHNDVSTTGELLPVTLQHVYNSYQYQNNYTQSYPSTGAGWKLSVQQTLPSSSVKGLTGESLEKFPYVYEDGDGTEQAM